VNVSQFAVIGLYVLKYAHNCIKSSLNIPVFMSRTTGATGVNFKLVTPLSSIQHVYLQAFFVPTSPNGNACEQIRPALH